MIFMDNKRTWILNADVGVTRPGGSFPMDKRARARIVHRGDDELMEIEENLDRLTLDIPDDAIDDLPRRF